MKNEMDTFQKSGQRVPNLQFAFDLLSTISPTIIIVESKKHVSLAGLVLTKFYSAMVQET